MSKGKIITITVLLFAICIAGFVYYSYTQTPQYTLLLIKKSIEERDSVGFERYVDIEGIIRRAGSQLAVELTNDFAARASQETGIPREALTSIASIFGPSLIESTIKQIRETLLSYIETRRMIPIQILPADTVDLYEEEIAIDASPTVEITGKVATLVLNLSILGEPVKVHLFMRQGEGHWEIVEIDQITKTVQNLLAAKVTGEKKRFERKRAAHPNVIINLPGLPRDAKHLELIYIPAGQFNMGSPENEKDHQEDETLHQVSITKPFYIGLYEITKAQFAEFVRDASYATTAEIKGESLIFNVKQNKFKLVKGVSWKNTLSTIPMDVFDGNDPVTHISWNDAAAFCDWLNRKNPQSNFRLPTEAEWEYACRAGTTTRRYWGDDDSDTAINDYAWYSDNSGGLSHPVGQKRPNGWGLYDMQGNVWEWCSDWYGAYSSAAQTDSPGAVSGDYRVFRGGGWNYYSRYCRSANRIYSYPYDTIYGLGFRVSRTP